MVLGRIIAGVATGGLSEVVRAVDKDAAHVLESAVNVVTPVSHVANGVNAGVQYANGNKLKAVRSAMRACPVVNTTTVPTDIQKCFTRNANAGDWVGRMRLFHITTVQAGTSIYQSRRMRPGVEGVLGGGIYGALSEMACLSKTRSGSSGGYAVVEFDADLGYCKQISEFNAIFRSICDGGMDVDLAMRKGFNSVGCDFNGGQEYVVFDPDRVTVINVTMR